MLHRRDLTEGGERHLCGIPFGLARRVTTLFVSCLREQFGQRRQRVVLERPAGRGRKRGCLKCSVRAQRDDVVWVALGDGVNGGERIIA